MKDKLRAAWEVLQGLVVLVGLILVLAAAFNGGDIVP